MDFLRPAATFERVVSPDAAPIRAPDTAPVKAPVTARLKNPPVPLAATTVFCAPLVDLDFFLAMRPSCNEAPSEVKIAKRRMTWLMSSDTQCNWSFEIESQGREGRG